MFKHTFLNSFHSFIVQVTSFLNEYTHVTKQEVHDIAKEMKKEKVSSITVFKTIKANITISALNVIEISWSAYCFMQKTLNFVSVSSSVLLSLRYMFVKLLFLLKIYLIVTETIVEAVVERLHFAFQKYA